MWFEILPSFGIIVGVLAVPHFLMYGVQKLALGNAYRRFLDERFDRIMYQRDIRIAGSPYDLKGLEQIPDE